jgi:hypothetical protein
LVPYRVDLGTRRAARLRAGRSISVETEPGPHVVTLWCGKARVGVATVKVDAAGTSAYLVTASQATWKSYLGIGSRPVVLKHIDT